MTDGLPLAHLILWTLVLSEATVLQYVLRETCSFERLYANLLERRRRRRLAPGTALPAIEHIVQSTEPLQTGTHSTDRSAILLFVAVRDQESALYDDLRATMHALWHKALGRLFVICDGDEVSCMGLAAKCTTGLSAHAIKLVIDTGGDITREFLVLSTPEAVILDDDGRIESYGMMIPEDDALLELVTASASGQHRFPPADTRSL